MKEREIAHRRDKKKNSHLSSLGHISMSRKEEEGGGNGLCAILGLCDLRVGFSSLLGLSVLWILSIQ